MTRPLQNHAIAIRAIDKPVRTQEQAKADIEAKRVHMKAAADYLAKRLAEKERT